MYWVLVRPKAAFLALPSTRVYALAIVGIAAILYSLALYVYGLVVCPSEG